MIKIKAVISKTKPAIAENKNKIPPAEKIYPITEIILPITDKNSIKNDFLRSNNAKRRTNYHHQINYPLV